MSGPGRVRFTDHARRQIARRRLGLDLVEALVLESHGQRRSNPGRANWRLEVRGVVVLYDWPSEDAATALVRSAWRR